MPKDDLIVTDPKILSQISKTTTSEEVQSLNLISRLIAANKTAWTDGAGLAAIQIGIPLRFAWYVVGGKEGTLLNPIITERFGVQKNREGCLSVPNMFIEVERPYSIEYLTNGKKKKASGFLARLIQHEIDHMDGLLITRFRRNDV